MELIMMPEETEKLVLWILVREKNDTWVLNARIIMRYDVI